MKKLIRITTVPISLSKLLEGQLRYMSASYEVIGVSSDEKILKQVGKKEGVETFHLEMTRKITPLKESDYGDLYLLTIKETGEVSLEKRHFGK